MSTSNLRRKVVWLVLLILTINLALNFFRQWVKHRNLILRLRVGQEQKKELEEENLKLEKQLELVKSPDYLHEQAGKLLGFSSNKAGKEELKGEETINQLLEVKSPNYEKWLRLFVY